MEEAKIVEEKELIKPEFKSDIKAKLTGVTKIEDNIKDVQNYALKLNEYYEKTKFTPETISNAKDEKAGVNKFKDKVKKFKKEIQEEYNKPLNNFIELCNTTISILDDTYSSINNQVKKYETEKKAKIKEKLVDYFNEYAKYKKIDFINFEQMNISITLGLETEKGQLTKKAKDNVSEFIDKISDDINLINTQQYIDEIMIEYKKDLNVSRAITDVNNRHVELERIQQEKENTKEQEITDEIMINKIDSLTAPKIEEKSNENREEILELSFKVRGTLTKLKELKQFLNNGGYDYE